ncbi:hypothetical protein M9Y10_032649 [Tritrichomonas musculus]|uniref:Calpain catalytic domain-containing protein n=1 Tax=Tritrichomonas musculus TaxID=1915356 RepID=A0ABR2GXG8_9EUKA
MLVENKSRAHNSDKIKIYSLLLDIKDDPTLNAKGEEYDNNVKQQVENRMKMKIDTSVDNKEFKKNVSKIESNNEKFNDPEYNSNTDKDSFTQSHWKRVEDIYTSQMFDASKNFNPNMIKQGSIGDCYLISSMAAVSKSTKLVQQMFTDPINNNAGMRCVNLHIMGKIVPVVVDPTIPFNGQSEHAFPIGCKPVKSDDQWWATFVEKAFAKQYGSYKAISGGNSHIAMYRMVGGFPAQYDLTDMKVKEMVQNGSMKENAAEMAQSMLFHLHWIQIWK